MTISSELYQKIIQNMPIPCVDLVIVNEQGKILLAKRINEPAHGEWWFPGGRVHYLETRVDAAVRKLREECGLEAARIIELGTFDVIVEDSDSRTKSHAITTIFIAEVGANPSVVLDGQNSACEWHLPLEWMKLELNPFLDQALALFMEYEQREGPR